MGIDIVIVNWNAGAQIYDCIQSIFRHDAGRKQVQNVTVVDNHSTDDSLERLGSLPYRLQIVRNTVNAGFGAACNQGAASGSGDYLLFLNPDTILNADTLDKVTQFLDATTEPVGVVGVQLRNEQGKVSHTCARFPTFASMGVKILGLDKLLPGKFHHYLMTEWPHDTNRRVDHIMGAFYLVPRPLFHQLNGFDEQFFVYLEDVDFSKRVADAGYASYFLADANAYHKGGGTSEQVKATRLMYSLRSRIRYVFKHFAIGQAIFITVGTLVGEPLIRCFHALIKGSWTTVRETTEAYIRLWKRVPGMARGQWRS
ncbi:glycosyltransferase family 2 protein [Paenibacillus swuensis]|nr:glycosyltransferase family 2 protein [Paenibacillus swuensis]